MDWMASRGSMSARQENTSMCASWYSGQVDTVMWDSARISTQVAPCSWNGSMSSARTVQLARLAAAHKPRHRAVQVDEPAGRPAFQEPAAELMCLEPLPDQLVILRVQRHKHRLGVHPKIAIAEQVLLCGDVPATHHVHHLARSAPSAACNPWPSRLARRSGESAALSGQVTHRAGRGILSFDAGLELLQQVFVVAVD